VEGTQKDSLSSMAWIMKVVILDTETTGFQKNEIVQLAYIKYLWFWYFTGAIYRSYFKPDNPIELWAMATHHITDEMVANNIKFDMQQLHDDIWKDFIIIAHNADYDIMVLQWYWDVQQKYICTMKVAVALNKWDNVWLQYLRYAMGIDFKWNPHDAVSDAQVCGLIFQKLQDIVMEEKWMTKEEFYEWAINISKEDVFLYWKHKHKFMSDVKIEDPWYFKRLIEAENKKPTPNAKDIATRSKYL